MAGLTAMVLFMLYFVHNRLKIAEYKYEAYWLINFR